MFNHLIVDTDMIDSKGSFFLHHELISGVLSSVSSSVAFEATILTFLGSDNLSASPIVPGSSFPLVSGKNRASAPLITADPPKMTIGSHAEVAESAATYGLRMAPTLAHIELKPTPTVRSGVG